MLKKIQAWTGVLFAVFVALHLVNTWVGGFGATAYDSVQSVFRVVYQFPPVEALLLAALAVHMVVGVMRIAREPRRELTPRSRLHRYAGFFLMVFIVGHILAVRGPSWFYDIYPGFQGLAFSIDYVPAYFYPYYFLLGVAGFYHGLNGLSIALARLGWRVRMSPLVLRNATAAAALLMVGTLLALGGFTTDPGDIYNSGFAQLALEIVGGSAP